MSNIASEHHESFGLTRRKFFGRAAVGLMSISFPLSINCSIAPLNNNLLEIRSLPAMPLTDEPLLELSSYKPGEGEDFKQQVLKDLSENPGLASRIKSDLGTQQQIKVVIEKAAYRLLYVPELRHKYRKGYEWYCRSVIDHLFARMVRPNFYEKIISPLDPLPISDGGGMTALLVHQLGREYRVQCRFSGDNGVSKLYLLQGADFSGNLGAVEVVVENPRREEFTIRRNNMTIWQNSSRNLYSLLLLPLEETLHYQLGPYTDARIADELTRSKTATVGRVRAVAQEWMAVEEAAVGGLADLLLDEYLSEHKMPFPRQERQHFINAHRHRFRYKYRAVGIKMGVHLGFQPMLDLYRSDPEGFAERLTA